MEAAFILTSDQLHDFQDNGVEDGLLQPQASSSLAPPSEEIAAPQSAQPDSVQLDSVLVATGNDVETLPKIPMQAPAGNRDAGLQPKHEDAVVNHSESTEAKRQFPLYEGI